MKEITTVQVVHWLSSESAKVSNACTGSNPSRGPFFPSFFSLPVMLGRQSTYTNNIPWAMLLTLDLDREMIT